MFRLVVDDEVEVGLLEERHAEALYTQVDRSRQELRRWLAWTDGTTSPAEGASRGCLEHGSDVQGEACQEHR